MKPLRLLMVIGILLIFTSGCASMKQNTSEINKLKGQLVTIESALARQNLLIQQNNSQIADLIDRNDELTMEIARVSRGREERRDRSAGTSAPARAKTSKKKGTTKSQVMSDKLVTKPSIREVQMALRNAGFYRGEIDGKVGPLTRSAIKNFQKANDLTVDGIIGRKTWSKLKEYL